MDILGVGDAAASLVGPQIYEEFVLPYEKKLVDGLHALGTRVRLHICGNTRRILTGIGRLGCEIVDIDSMVPLDQARREIGPAAALGQHRSGEGAPQRLARIDRRGPGPVPAPSRPALDRGRRLRGAAGHAGGERVCAAGLRPRHTSPKRQRGTIARSAAVPCPRLRGHVAGGPDSLLSGCRRHKRFSTGKPRRLLLRNTDSKLSAPPCIGMAPGLHSGVNAPILYSSRVASRLIFFAEGAGYGQTLAETGIHPRRAAGSDRNHSHPHRLGPAGSFGGARSSTTGDSARAI